MRTVVIGSAGRTGALTVDRALGKGMQVVALQRRAPAAPNPLVEYVIGDAADEAVLEKALTGAQLVLLCVGPSTTGDPETCSKTTSAVIRVMKRVGVKRIVAVTGVMIGHPRDRLSWVFKTMECLSPSLRRSLEERRNQERALMGSGLDWTLVRPPRLVDAGGGNVIAGEDPWVGMMAALPRQSLASFLVGEAAGPVWVKRTASVLAGN